MRRFILSHQGFLTLVRRVRFTVLSLFRRKDAGQGLIGWDEEEVVRDPAVIRQAGEVWCAAACGEMLLAARGVAGTQQEIVAHAGITHKGLSDAMLVWALTQLDATPHHLWQSGYITLPEAASREVVARTLTSTGTWAAVIQTEAAFFHMVVVAGVDAGGHVIIHDPAEGQRYTVTMVDFLAHWTGIAVYAQPASTKSS